MKKTLIAALVLLAAGCGRNVPSPDPAYLAEVEAWRAERLQRLTAADGWLTVVGLHWLVPGVNRFGSDPANEIPLRSPDVPPLVGTVELLADGSLIARAEAGTGVTVNGAPLAEATLHSDAQGKPDILGVSRLTFYIIDRGGRLGARVKDPEAAARKEFTGIEHFPIDPRYRVTARLDPYPKPREVPIPTVLGTPTTMLAPGVLRFTLLGKEVSLEPYRESPGEDTYFLIFRDRTSGDTTYGGGRFLDAAAVGADGLTVLDFNLAYSPPCAFTPHATCPLPPPQNSLRVAVEAGEKFAGHGH
ncbi:MAG: hypothetical protein C3F15_00405 [Holophagae bacterium]|nr:MAG: hypothetical protein C3F15_00405 [Holophagae bacterium]